MSLNSSIGNKIANLRKEYGMTQEQLAEKLDISIKHCSSVERGISCLSLEKLVEISNLFDVSLDYLVKDSSPANLSLEQIYASFPQSVIEILTSQDEEEIQLLHEYLRFYTKIHNIRYDK